MTSFVGGRDGGISSEVRGRPDRDRRSGRSVSARERSGDPQGNGARGKAQTIAARFDDGVLRHRVGAVRERRVSRGVATFVGWRDVDLAGSDPSGDRVSDHAGTAATYIRTDRSAL